MNYQAELPLSRRARPRPLEHRRPLDWKGIAMYTCGLDIGEKSIHGCCLINSSSHTVRQFCIPRKPEHLVHQLKKLMHELEVRPCSLRLVAADYADHLDELIRPQWANGHPRNQRILQGAQVDRLLMQSYRQQRAWWDRAHLLAYWAMEDDFLEPANDDELCRRWNVHRIREKLNYLEGHRARVRRPDWLREPTQCLIHPGPCPF